MPCSEAPPPLPPSPGWARTVSRRLTVIGPGWDCCAPPAGLGECGELREADREDDPGLPLVLGEPAERSCRADIGEPRGP